MKKKIIFETGFLIIVLIILNYSCAIVKTPEGGQKDTIPPKIVKEKPVNYSLNFNNKQIELIFDEFIQVKDVKQNLIISPPIKTKPDVKIKNNKIIIYFHDSLQSNTTYSFNFGDCISDINEGNILQNFKYILSTGQNLDSGKVSGKVLDAYSKKANWGIKVGLYPIHCDSCINGKIPIYYSKTDSFGSFEIDNIKFGKYNIIAFSDENNNNKYDIGEKIGFVKEPVTISEKAVKIDFLLFREQKTIAEVADCKIVNEKILKIVMNGFANDLSIFQHIQFSEKRLLTRINKQQDTILAWYYSEQTDSLVFHIKSSLMDSVLKFKKPTEEKKHNLTPKKLYINQYSDFYKSEKMYLFFSEPILSVNEKEIVIIQDSVKMRFPIKYDFVDSSLTSCILNYKLIPGKNYTFIIPDSTFKGIYQNTNDTFTFSTSVKNENELGALTIDVTISDSVKQAIVELVNSQSVVVRTKKITRSTKIFFYNLIPDLYTIRVIADNNENGIWDSGSLKDKRQPEAVFYYQDVILLKPNWEISDINFNIP